MRVLLLVALLGAVALGAWNLVRVDGDPAAAEASAESAAGGRKFEHKPPVPEGSAWQPPPREPKPPQDPEALSLERHPERVADDAAILGHYLPTLTWQTRAWYDDVGIDFHVATLANSRLPIDELAAEVLTRRRVGARAPTGGILLVLDPEKREARIEVSYELEGAFPDALVGRIAEDQLVPYVAYSAVGMATMDVLHFLKDVAIQQSLAGRLALDTSYKSRRAYVERARFLSGGGGARVALPTIEELASRDFKAPVPAAERARYAPSEDATESVEALLRALRDMAGDPALPLYTEGTQCQKAHYPFAPYESAERAMKLEAAKPWRIVTRDDRAVVTAGKRVHGFVPVLLQRVQGTWRVDGVETWKNLFFDENGEYHLKNANTPYAFGLGAHGSGRLFEDIAPWDTGGVPLAKVMAKLEATPGPLYDFLLGELLFRNCFLPDKAFQHYRAASQRARSPLFAETLGDRARYVNFHDLAIEAYERMIHWGHPKLAAVYAEKGDFTKAVEVQRQVVDQNPYDVAALRVLQGYLERAGRQDEAVEVAREADSLERDPRGRQLPLQVVFAPEDPVYDRQGFTLVGDTKVYDHAHFGVTITNPSARSVDVERVRVRTVGYGPGMSGLGDIRGYFRWPQEHRLEPGQSVQVSRTWGFTTRTGHEQLSYVIDLCWRGEGDAQQCGTHRLDLMPR